MSCAISKGSSRNSRPGAFEEGIRLVRYLGDNLTAVEKRVEVLIRDQGGAFQLQAIAEDEEEE